MYVVFLHSFPVMATDKLMKLINIRQRWSQTYRLPF